MSEVVHTNSWIPKQKSMVLTGRPGSLFIVFFSSEMNQVSAVLIIKLENIINTQITLTELKMNQSIVIDIYC